MAKEDIIKLAKDFNTRYGRSVMATGSDIPFIRRISCGIPAIDFISSGGVAPLGIPINRTIELYGANASGKTYIALKTIAEFQHFDWRSYTQRGINSVEWEPQSVKIKERKASMPVEQELWVEKKINSEFKNPRLKRAALVDFEKTYDPAWGRQLGVDNCGLLHIVPEIASQGVDIITTLLMNPDISLVVVDSIAAAGADAEIEASMEDQQMGINARFWNKAMRKFQSSMNSNPEEDITLLIINRPYSKIGMIYGSPEEIGGGSGLKFGKSLAIRTHPVEISEDKVEGVTEPIGRNIKCKCVKNKTARPFMESRFYLSFMDTDMMKAGETDITMQLVDIAMKKGLITIGGAWYTYGKLRSQGKEKFVSDLENEGLIEQLHNEIYNL